MTVYFPSQVILEVTSACNLRCKGCAIHGPDSFVTRPAGPMPEEIWRTAIAEIGSWNRQLNLTTHGGGEPLLHPRLKEILQFAKSFPELQAGFLTNGMLFDTNWSEFALSVGLDWVAFSIDGVSAETHRIVRKNSDLDVIEKNLADLLSLRKREKSQKPYTSLNMVAYEEVADQKELFVKRWLNQVDNITISHYRNPPNSKRWPLVPSERTPCFLLWSQMVIASDGRVGLCCEDFNIDFPFGRIGEKPLIEIWNGPEISELRKMHEKGDFASHPMCRDCDTWADNIIQKTEDNDHIGCQMFYKASQIEYKPLLRKSENITLPYPTEDHPAMVAALGILPHEKVLDVGGGHFPFSRADVVVDIDFASGQHRDGSKMMIDFSKHGYVQADMTELPFKDKCFDVVVCIQALEHTARPEKACEELMRVAHRGFIETPRKWTEYYAGHPTHRWLIDDVNNVLTFEPIVFDRSPFHNFALPPLWNSPEMLGKSLTEHRHIACVQWVWQDRFAYRVMAGSPVSEVSLAARHYHFAGNLLYWMAPVEQGLFHAALAAEKCPDNPEYSKRYAVYLALCGKWRLAFRHGLSLKLSVDVIESYLMLKFFRRLVAWYRYRFEKIR